MNFLKKTAVAWCLTAVMIVVGIVAGQGNASVDPTPDPPSVIETIPMDSAPVIDAFYVWDEADVLSADEVSALSRINEELSDRFGTVVACVTTNYGGDDLCSYALDFAEDVYLQGNDFIVVLDIKGDNYWLLQGAGLVDLFSDEECSSYAYTYLEDDFARGDYGQALIELAEALQQWYQRNG